MDGQMKEIRQLLLGRFEHGEDGCLTARPIGQRADIRSVQGVSTGWGAVHFLGIAHRSRLIEMPAGTKAERLDEAMRTLGRPVRLETSPMLSACLIQRLMATPVVLTACWDGTEVDVTAYTARGVTSPTPPPSPFRKCSISDMVKRSAQPPGERLSRIKSASSCSRVPRSGKGVFLSRTETAFAVSCCFSKPPRWIMFVSVVSAMRDNSAAQAASLTDSPSDNSEVGRRVTLKSGACMLLPEVYADSFVFRSGGAFYPLADYENRRHFYACYRKGEAVKPYTRAFIMITAAVLAPNAERRGAAR